MRGEGRHVDRSSIHDLEVKRVDIFNQDKNLLDANRALLAKGDTRVGDVDTAAEIRKLIEKLSSLRADAREKIRDLQAANEKMKQELGATLPSREADVKERINSNERYIRDQYQPILDQPPFILPGDVVKVERSKKDDRGKPVKEDWKVNAYDDGEQTYDLSAQRKERDPSSPRIVRMRVPHKDGISIAELEAWNAQPIDW